MLRLYQLDSGLSNVCPMMVQRDENPEAAQPRAGEGARSAPASFVRIGELSRRTGVRAETIRAWERRYGLIEPARSAGGFRLYSPAEEERVHAMRALIAEGVAAAEAATQARSGGGAAVPSVRSPDAEADRLRAALEAYDEEAANAVLDRALSAFSLDVFTGAVVLPAMAEIGNRWAGGEASVAQEHFATSVVRGRLLAISRGWGSGRGPLAVLACPPGEQHDIGLIAFGLSLRNRGWRIVYLGQDTPLDTLAETVQQLAPALVVLSVAAADSLASAVRGLLEVAALVPVWIGGRGASEEMVRRAGAGVLKERPTEAAARLAAGATSPLVE
jgi:MerR family transcriptional regulator, light-induced transcriptional regulator